MQPLLNAEHLARLAGLQLRVQSVVEGTLTGLHRSPHHGGSIEFAEHKEYAPGDDLRHLDWKALGKFDRYYIKRFEHETDLKAYLLLDASGSMGYGRPLSKLEYASTLLASLAYILLRQGDQPSLLGFSERVRTYVPPRSRSSHALELVGAMEQLTAEGGTDLARAVEHLSEVMARRSLVVLVSDLFDGGDAGLGTVRHLRARGHHVVVFHLFHPDELEFPFTQLTNFQGMEEEREVLVDPGGVRRAYHKEMDKFRQRARLACQEGEVEYHQVTTDEPLDRVLLGFLRRVRGQ